MKLGFLLLTTKNPDWYSRSGNISLLFVKGHCKIYRANKYSKILRVSQGVRVSCWTRCSWPFLKSFLKRNNRMSTAHAVSIGESKIWFLLSYQTEMQNTSYPLKSIQLTFLSALRYHIAQEVQSRPLKNLNFYPA